MRLAEKEVVEPEVVQLLAGITIVEAGFRVDTRVIAIMVAATELVIPKVTVLVPGVGVTDEVMLAVGVREVLAV